jgi:hypothetical protein
MSLVDRINQRTNLKQRDDSSFIRNYAFILALIGMALALVVASVVFTPVPIGAGITNEIMSVGP